MEFVSVLSANWRGCPGVSLCGAKAYACVRHCGRTWADAARRAVWLGSVCPTGSVGFQLPSWYLPSGPGRLGVSSRLAERAEQGAWAEPAGMLSVEAAMDFTEPPSPVEASTRTSWWSGT